MADNNQGDGASGSFFSTIPDFYSIQLDIVGFLAILGEGSVLANAQVSTLSKWMFVPRLLPAPQALLRPSRPSRLDPALGRVTGVVSGNDRDALNHIGSIVLDADSLNEFDVRCVEIERNDEAPVVKARAFGWLTANNVLGALFALAILVLAAIWEDGMALIAVCCLSLLSTVIGFGNKWTLKLPKRRYTKGKVPRGDVVIRHPKGSFLVVRCSEDVAREIFFAPENIEYLIEDQVLYRLLALVGSIMLMAGVICLANCKVKSQICFAAAYLILNASYWIVAAIPARVHWNTSAFIVRPQCIGEAKERTKFTDKNDSFTQALFKAIVATKETDWVQLGDAAPRTDVWNQWLREAKEAARGAGVDYDKETKMTVYKVPTDFDPQGRLRDLLNDPDFNQHMTQAAQS
ncbi:hypothetical protein BFW01_g10640 [Lasiodiplodia theobromae]|uniref:Uncharacterized protein n=2 Tax=Lasiodiplodia TaxID=66739 RepID=A0A5N5DTV0_9PEZI|nr:uncharacterized protein LTHEOB_9761 [Lasiodiplodia theobromae]KAB2581130.1 hypothetical protein DBV05_g294 [Lasiodiplodia theobromae]KAF4539949.1 hypothetical protein LTHEOB_9761 [Lasiodiplodia theobromae]KAF9629437.1 hypothetical protein BFW01_g10640 [Lasiodiplodia theobromae]KAK0664355.1 hypothetical protein DIS24_g751 [Lasiodiplodia hormozganensis]